VHAIRVSQPDQEPNVQQRKSTSTPSKTQQSAVPAAKTSKPVPLPLDSDLLRQVGGGNSLPNKGW